MRRVISIRSMVVLGTPTPLLMQAGPRSKRTVWQSAG